MLFDFLVFWFYFYFLYLVLIYVYVISFRGEILFDGCYVGLYVVCGEKICLKVEGGFLRFVSDMVDLGCCLE